MMTEAEILAILKETNVWQKGHFRFTSGRHSDQYLQCAQLLQYPKYAAKICTELATHFQADRIDTVIGPALGGIIIAYEVARVLGVRAIFAEREEEKMLLRRGFQIEKGERVLVVEDVITTGGSVNEVLELVTMNGGLIVGVGALIDRSRGRAEFGVKMVSLLQMDLIDYSPAECPLCQQGIPIIKPGSRKNPAK